MNKVTEMLGADVHVGDTVIILKMFLVLKMGNTKRITDAYRKQVTCCR